MREYNGRQIADVRSPPHSTPRKPHLLHTSRTSPTPRTLYATARKPHTIVASHHSKVGSSHSTVASPSASVPVVSWLVQLVEWMSQVYPQDGGDKMKPTKGWRCELWMMPGKEASQGAFMDCKPRPDSCGLVLGAGNVTALAVIDCLHLLFQQNTVVLYKVN